MANPANRTSENILKEGVLRHKNTSVALARWKLRYVVFKTMSSGRFQLMIYKEHPPSPSNEIKEIPIEDFGGIEPNLKLDSEKNAFAIISTNFTDCFSAETPEMMQDWVRTLQKYLGKELVLNITIPHKQNMLKSGRAQLRIRNTGFTITTCDSPPRCQGTWLIIHIRKFGGSDAFRFETGSKCPSGEFRYTISTDDNARVKALFNDLSQHKPIFTDDVVGRRMTLERRIRRENRMTSPAPHPHPHPGFKGNRLSLQSREAPAHLYENRLQHINRDQFRYNSADLLTQPPTGRRHSANEDRIYNPLTRPVPRELLMNGSSRSIEDLRDRDYQNVHRTSAQGRSSPLKRNQVASSVVVSGDIPEGYYNVSPPRVLGRFRNSSTSPPNASSPEEESFLPLNGFVMKGEGRSGKSPPIEEEDEGVTEEEYMKFSPVTVSLQGEHLVVQRGSTLNGHAGSTALNHRLTRLQTPPTQQPDGPEAMYENLEFMRGTGSGGSNPTSPSHRTGREGEESRQATTSFFPSADSTPAPEQTPVSDADWSPHNYTNVEFALEAAQRRPTARAVSPRKTFPRHNASSLVHQVHTKKPSIPARRGLSEHHRKISAPNCNSDPHSHHLLASLSPTSLTALGHRGGLRSSHSNFELQSENTDGLESGKPGSAALPEYYNLFVPDLPARADRHTESVDSGVVVGTSSQPQSPGVESSKSGTESDRTSVTSPAVMSSPPPPPSADPDVTTIPITTDGYAKFLRGSKPPVMGASVAGRGYPSNYDHLEIKSPHLSPEPEPRATSPRLGCYDSLAPVTDENQRLQILDFSAPGSRNGGKSSSPSPEPLLLPPAIVQKVARYQRKTNLLGHQHTYEYIDIEPAVSGSSSPSDGESQQPHKRSGTPSRLNRSGSESPTGNEHPLDWLSPKQTLSGDASSVFNFEEERSKRDCASPPPAIGHRFSHKTTNSGSRRKPLPLQDASLEEGDGVGKGVGGATAGGVDKAAESEASPKLPPKKSKLRSGSEKLRGSGRDVAGPETLREEETPKLPLKKSKQRNGSGRQGSPSGDVEEAPKVPKKKSKYPGLLSSAPMDWVVERSESDHHRKPLPLPKSKHRTIRVASQTSSDSSELVSSGEQEDAEMAKRQSTVSNESASSVDSDRIKALTLPSGRNLRATSPLARGTHENVTLKPAPRKIKSITVETVQEGAVTVDAISGPECPPRPPKLTRNKHPISLSSEEQLSPPTPGEEEVDCTPPPRPKPPSDSGNSPTHVPPEQEGARPPIPPYPKNFTVQLPHTNIEFHKPPVPPKPRLLSHVSDPGDEERAKYISVDFANSYLAEARAKKAVGDSFKSQTLGSANRLERVDYLAIDFKMSAQLAILKEEREEERREFIEASKKN